MYMAMLNSAIRLSEKGSAGHTKMQCNILKRPGTRAKLFKL